MRFAKCLIEAKFSLTVSLLPIGLLQLSLRCWDAMGEFAVRCTIER